MTPIYLDYNATTPVLPAVLDAMLPFLRAEFGNPSSAHAFGRRAKDAVGTARAQVATLIGAAPDEIVFTSGGTEASNLAIRGTAHRGTGKLPIVTSNIEHPATDAPCELLAQQGYPLKRIKARPDGIIDIDEAAAAIRAGAGLVTIIHAQNEIGTLQPVAEVAALAHEQGALIHVDAAQSVGKVRVDVKSMGVDLLSIAGHKLYAPKGVGALYIRRGVALEPLLRGAGQESGRRPGTENVPYLVGLGEACRLAAVRLQDGRHEIESLANELLDRLRREVPGIVLVGHATERLANTLNILFPGVSGRQLLEACPRVLASTGSACHADREEASSILRALDIPEEQALGAVRLSLGVPTTRQDVEEAASALAAAWRMITGNSASVAKRSTAPV
ncbi:MAG: cysteine desulfurase [Bradyrhizobiaceae bacterium]|nr:cysteine desulfurase [Bradyrhizobiaceae bacterium]